MNELISIIILNYNGSGFLQDCLKSVFSSNYPNFEVILVDNASTDNSLRDAYDEFSKYKNLKFIKNDKNYLFTGGNNIGIREAKGDYIIILNNDTVVEHDWLNLIPEKMESKDIAAAQPKIYAYDSNPLTLDYIGGTINKCGYAIGIGMGEADRGQYDSLRDIFYTGGAAMIIKKKVLKEVGLFDEKFGMHWEDTDLCWRIRLAGYKIITIPESVIYHKGSKTMSKFAEKANIAWYIRKNRMAGLIKNYSALNLFLYLPALLISYFLLFLKETILDRNIKLGLSSVKAVIWNIKELPYFLRQRRIAQNKIRVVPDKNIMKYMSNGH